VETSTTRALRRSYVKLLLRWVTAAVQRFPRRCQCFLRYAIAWPFLIGLPTTAQAQEDIRAPLLQEIAKLRNQLGMQPYQTGASNPQSAIAQP
jgi:hypothetical protein